MTKKKGKADEITIRYADTQIREIVVRYREVEDAPEQFSRAQAVRAPEDIYSAFRFMFNGLLYERFVVFVMAANNKVITANTVTTGLLNASLTHPREVFRPAIICGAASIIVAHNHPSGNAEPSNEDIAVTRQIKEAGKILGIPLHDHIIFAGDSFTSMMERGLI